MIVLPSNFRARDCLRLLAILLHYLGRKRAYDCICIRGANDATVRVKEPLEAPHDLELYVRFCLIGSELIVYRLSASILDCARLFRHLSNKTL